VEFQQEDRVVVIDNGSDTCKIGFGGDDKPSVVFPCVVGRTRPRGVLVGMGRNTYIGDEAHKCRGFGLDMICPIERGIITDWDNMENIWRYAFNEVYEYPKNIPS